MAQKRMFNISITDTDKFLDMPATSQNLYFHLNMHADDDGFVDSPKRIMRNVSASQDDMNILLSKQFIFVFESGVLVIRDWKIHNIIRKDTYKPTLYEEEKNLLEVAKTGAYQFRNEHVTETRETVAQIRLDKNRLDKNRIDEVREEKSNSSSNSQNLKYFFEKWQEITGNFPSSFELEDIPKLHQEDGFSIELMLTALKEAANSTSNFNFNYFKSILMRYKRQGLLTPEMVAGAEKQRQEAKSKQYNQQPSKSNVPDWVEADYKHEATADEQAQLEALKQAFLED